MPKATAKSRTLDMEKLALKVMYEREAKRWSLRKVAQVTGISASTLSRIETLKGEVPDFNTVIALADWLNLPVDSLIEEVK